MWSAHESLLIVLLPFFEWCETTPVAQWVSGGVWQFAVIEAVHLLGLGLLGGSLLLVDLRMLGVGLTKQAIADLEAQMRVWLLGALVLMALTGVPLFLSEAIKCYYNTSFWVKMTTLPFAVAYTFSVRARVARGSRDTTMRTRLAAAASIALWFTVAAAGRWIGFSS